MLSVKKRCLLIEGKQKDNLEEQIVQYLRTEILPLWPEGWMYLNNLKKVYNSMTENAKLSENGTSRKEPPSVTITPVIPAQSDSLPSNLSVNKVTNSHVSSFNINDLIRDKRDSDNAKFERETERKKSDSPQENPRHSVESDPPKSAVISNHRKEEPRESKAVISSTPHCQLIDLTEESKHKSKPKQRDSSPARTSCDAKKLSSRHPEISLTPTFSAQKSDGDDIQTVMENLRALQKLSSPVKSDSNPTGSPVSVIAYNKSFSPKSSSSQGSNTAKSDFAGTFQDEFQKQFISSLQQMAAGSSSTKSGFNNRCS